VASARPWFPRRPRKGGALPNPNKREWLIKPLIEAVLVVASILLALAVDEWAEDREYAELADQSLEIFEQEIARNQARIEDVSPFHTGVRDVVGSMRFAPANEVELRGVTEGVDPPVLLSTAWQTALATGALTHMDVEVVSALSLTYSLQDRFMDEIRTERPDRNLVLDGLPEAAVRARVEQTYEYLSALTSGESELLAVYQQVRQVIDEHRLEPATGPPSDTLAAADGS